MKAFKALGTTYESKSAMVRDLLVGCGDVIDNSDIARMADVTPQTVYAVKMKLALGEYVRVA